MKFAKEFKEFIMRGNVVDMAIGVVIGTAFGAIVNSLVADLIMPLITLITGRVAFTDLFIPLDGKEYESLAAAQEAGGSVWAYGNFIQTVIQFLIIALSIFICIKIVSSVRRKKEEEPEAPPEPSKEEVLLTEIRDLLKEQNDQNK